VAGRRPKLSYHHKLRIRNKLLYNPWMTIKEPAKSWIVCPQTIRAYLKSLGYRWRNPMRKPKLSDKDKRVRFEWAQSHKNYNFSNVVFG